MPKASTIITIPATTGDGLRVTLCEAKYFTEKEMDKSIEALCILSYVLDLKEFEDRVLASSFTTTTLTPAEVLKKIKKSNESSGAEGTFGYDHAQDDSEVDLVLSMYSARFSKVIGYTMPSKIAVFINRKYFTMFKPWQVAGNWFHEHTHNLKFSHSHAGDSKSVPYLLGDLVEELGKKHYREAIRTRKPLVETHVRTGKLV